MGKTNEVHQNQNWEKRKKKVSCPITTINPVTPLTRLWGGGYPVTPLIGYREVLGHPSYQVPTINRSPLLPGTLITCRYSILPGTRYCCSVHRRHHLVSTYGVAGLYHVRMSPYGKIHFHTIESFFTCTKWCMNLITVENKTKTDFVYCGLLRWLYTMRDVWFVCVMRAIRE